jgi:cell division protein ZapE
MMGQAAGTVAQTYQAELEKRGYVSDPAQLRAVAVLDQCAKEWAQYKQQRSGLLGKLGKRPPLPKGVYLYGGVGRGKSFLMDCFFQCVPIRRKARLHFHEFMREVHRELAALQGTVNPLDELAKQMAKRYRLICFDEFHVADITDAMILHRLLLAMFDNGIGFVTTSNFKPDRLYPGGMLRDRILPAIEMLNASLHVVEVDHQVDYRQQTLAELDFYHCPLSAAANSAMRDAFERLAECADESPSLMIENREIVAARRAGGVIWFDFQSLCAGPRSQNDYLEIASQFHTVLLSDVPQMPMSMSNPARRFTWLVDVLYDRHVKLIVSAAVAPELLYLEGPLAHEFVRTASRLQEMQSATYLSQDARSVDTALT